MLSDLFERLPPPRASASIDWADAERRLGAPVPGELKALVDRYGAGDLAGVIELLSPAEPRSALNMLVSARQDQQAVSPTHLLALARDASGRPLVWQRRGGDPDAWPILVDFEPLPGSLSELLLAALDGRGPLPRRDGPAPEVPEDEPRWTVAHALSAMEPRTRDGGALSRLVSVAPPPDGVAPASWEDTEATLGTPLPADFRALLDRYGSGEFGTELYVLAPPRLAAFSGELLDGLRALQRWHLDPVTDEPAYRVWPEAGGLLPWARFMGAVQLHWWTGAGSPDDWPILLEDVDDVDPWWAFDGTATEFLLALYERSAAVPMFDEWESGPFRTLA